MMKKKDARMSVMSEILQGREEGGKREGRGREEGGRREERNTPYYDCLQGKAGGRKGGREGREGRKYRRDLHQQVF